MILARLQAVLDSSGAGTATAQPAGANQYWLVHRASCQGNSVAQPSLALYRGSIEASRFIDGSGAANADLGEWEAPIKLWSADTLVARWTTGSPGAVMQLILEGEQYGL